GFFARYPRGPHAGAGQAQFQDFLAERLLQVEVPAFRQRGDLLAQEIVVHGFTQLVAPDAVVRLEVQVDVDHHALARLLLEVVDPDGNAGFEIPQEDAAARCQVVHVCRLRFRTARRAGSATGAGRRRR